MTGDAETKENPSTYLPGFCREAPEDTSKHELRKTIMGKRPLRALATGSIDKELGRNREGISSEKDPVWSLFGSSTYSMASPCNGAGSLPMFGCLCSKDFS